MKLVTLCALGALLALGLGDQLPFGGQLDAVAGFDRKSRVVWADVNASKVIALQPGSFADTWLESWPLPKSNSHPFNHVFTQYAPVLSLLAYQSIKLILFGQAGHPSFDGYGGGYGRMHVGLT